MRIIIIINFNLLEPTLEILEKNSAGPVKKIFKIFLWLIIIVLILIGSAITLVFVYEDEVKEVIIKELNKNLISEVKIDPKNIDLTLIKSFPDCALEFKDVLILEALEKKNRDTLIYASDILLMFNLKDLWNKNYTINKITINKAKCYLQINKKGRPNYIFWKSVAKSDGDLVKFSLDKIALNEIELRYKNHKQKFKTAIYFHNSEFSGNFGDEQFALTTKGKADLEYLTVNKSNLLKNKKLKYDLEFEISKSLYTITRAEVALNEMYFLAEGNCKYSDSLEKADITFSGKNLDIASVLSLLPEKDAERINDYESTGDFYSKGSLIYKSGEAPVINAEFGIKNAGVTYKPKNTRLNNLNIVGKLVSNQTESFLNLESVSAELGSNTIKGFCTITNLSDPYLNIDAAVNTKLDELNAFWPIDTLEYISGSIDLRATLKGKVSDMKQSAFSQNIIAQGTADLKEIKAKLRGKNNEINIPQGSFEMAKRNVKVSGFKILIGKSDFELNGELPGFINYLTDASLPLVIDANVKSSNVVLEDVLYGGQTSSAGKQINIPANLSFRLLADIGNLSFSKFEAKSIKGDIVITGQKLIVNDLLLNTMDGKAQLSAVADASGEKIAIKAVADLNEINISKLFYQCSGFGQNTLNEKHLNGFATTTINFSGNWSKELVADLESVTSNGNITIEQGRLVDFKPLLSLSKYVEVNELKDIRFQALQSSFDIKNQIISIPKTTIKNSAMNIELWGKHTFRNEIDYHIKLLMSELIANKKRANKQLDEEMVLEENDPENRRCVFILMTGTVENPIIKYDKKGLKQKIREDLKVEKQTLKQILKEEFGLFKKDSTLNKQIAPKGEQKFKIELGENKEQKANNLQPKKKEDEDDDF